MTHPVLDFLASRGVRIRCQPRVWPETLVSGWRLRPDMTWSGVSGTSKTKTSAQVGHQRLEILEHYIKPFSTFRRACSFHSLFTINAKLKFTRSPSLSTRTWTPFGIQRRRPRSILPPKGFEFFIHFIELLVTLGLLKTLAERRRLLLNFCV
jgi:hypothetical protein